AVIEKFADGRRHCVGVAFRNQDASLLVDNYLRGTATSGSDACQSTLSCFSKDQSKSFVMARSQDKEVESLKKISNVLGPSRKSHNVGQVFRRDRLHQRCVKWLERLTANHKSCLWIRASHLRSG